MQDPLPVVANLFAVFPKVRELAWRPKQLEDLARS
jgi:hypothetical protein